MAFLLGTGLGVVGGFVFAKKYLEEKATDPENALHPTLLSNFPYDDSSEDTGPTPELLRQLSNMTESQKTALYKHLPLWIKDPEFERCQWFHAFLAELYESMTVQLKKDIVSNTRWSLAYVIPTVAQLEDIEFDCELGKVPWKLLGAKVAAANVDQVIMELGLSWPSDMQVDIKAKLRLAGFRLTVPVKLTDVVFRAHLRVCLKPLSDVIPCFSGVSISFMSKPHFDAKLHLWSDYLDLMALPGVSQGIKWAVQQYVFKPMFVYPKELWVPMAWYEQDKDPVGLLEVKLHFGRNLRGAKSTDQAVDPYVILWLDSNDHCRSGTIRSTSVPTWEETKVVLLDDLKNRLQLQVYDDEFGQGLLSQKKDSKKKRKDPKDPLTETNASGDPLLAKFWYPPREDRGLRDTPAVKYPHHWHHTVLRSDVSELSVSIRFIPTMSKEQQQAALQTARKGWAKGAGPAYEEKGVLTVELIRAEKLSSSAVQDGSVDPYVALRLLDRVPIGLAEEEGLNPNKSQKKPGHTRRPSGASNVVRRTKAGTFMVRELYEQSSTQLYDENPIFNESFKFVNISQESQLVVEVWDVPMKKSQDDVICIGCTTIEISEVVKNRSLQQEFILTPSETESDASPSEVRGKVLMALKWKQFSFEAPKGEMDVPEDATTLGMEPPSVRPSVNGVPGPSGVAKSAPSTTK